MKPVEAIERMRKGYGDNYLGGSADWRAILAYLDSLPEWPADLTRGRLEELADSLGRRFVSKTSSKVIDALLRLAELAPRKEKRKVEIWENDLDKDAALIPIGQHPSFTRPGWRKVGEAEIDA